MDKIDSNKKQPLYFPQTLTEVLQNVSEYPLTTVVAPMGYGKTTAVRENMRNADANILWLSLYDDSKTAFWNGLCGLFVSLDRECSNHLLQLGFPEDSRSLHIVLTLIQTLDLRKQIVIVIDDFHLAETIETVNLITFLVMNEITNLNIVIIARFLRRFKMEELSLKGYLLHIKKDYFKFMEKDIINYYKSCDINITKEEATRLYLLTEGWISALYLLMLNFKKTGQLLLSLEIYQLIGQVGYEPFSDDCKKFLLSISIYHDFTRELASFITPDVDSIINEITMQNTFIEYDPIRKVHYIHAIFANYLTNKLERMPKAYQEDLYKKAGAWYLQRGEYIQAMRYAYLGSDFDILLQALANDKGKNINGEHRTMLIKYFEACPLENKKKNLFAVLMYARHMLTFNETAIFKKTCEEFISIINQTDMQDLVYKNRLLAEFELLMCITEYNDIEKMMVYIRRACALSKDTSVIFNDDSPYTFGSPSILYLYYRSSGCLLKEVNEVQDSHPFYCRLTGNHGKGADEIMKAERYYYMGDFQNAEISMYKAYQMGITETSGIVLCAMFLNIRLSFIKGDLEDIRKLFQKLRDVYKIKQYVFVQTIDLCEAYVFSILHRREKVQLWIQDGEFENTRIFPAALGFIHIVYGKVLLENGEYLKLIGRTEQFLKTASIYPNALGKIYTYIYLGQANRQIYRYDEAIVALKKALDIAMPDKVYMPFVENCEGIKQSLEEIYARGVYQGEISKILELYKVFHKGKSKMLKEFLPEQKPPLTQREKETATLAAQGLSNKEICKRLYISENTVKTQLKSIYSKLNINSRTLLKQNL